MLEVLEWDFYFLGRTLQNRYLGHELSDHPHPSLVCDVRFIDCLCHPDLIDNSCQV